MLKLKVPAYVTVLSTVAGVALTVVLLGSTDEAESPPVRSSEKECDVRFQRMRGYAHIKPLLYTEHACESPGYDGIKRLVGEHIEQQKSAGVLTDAGFYLRDFRHSDWTAYHGDHQFEPGSLLKIPLLITYLRMAERDPTVMSRTYTFKPEAYTRQNVRFPPAKRIEAGITYTVPQLLDHAIRYSDNHAVEILLRNVDVPLFHRTYTDVGLRDFTASETSYPLTPKEISVFMKALYNASYLSLEDSELAVSMLMTSTFDVGLQAGLPPGTRIAHKFGESFNGVDWQLHETAFIYAGSDAYLLTVMTKGPRMEDLPEVLASISRLVHGEMSRSQGSDTPAQR